MCDSKNGTAAGGLFLKTSRTGFDCPFLSRRVGGRSVAFGAEGPLPGVEPVGVASVKATAAYYMEFQ